MMTIFATTTTTMMMIKCPKGAQTLRAAVLMYTQGVLNKK